jgi:hypothetical protein
MTIIATDKTRLSHLLKQELWAEIAYCREVVVVNDTAGTLDIGTVLGKVTATGKFKRAVQTASDGSQNAAAIVIKVTPVAGSTDTNVLTLVRGPASVSKAGLILDATFDTDAEKQAVYASLQALGIQTLDAA